MLHRLVSLSQHKPSLFPSPFRPFKIRNYSATRLTSFDERWKKLTQAEKDLVAKEYEHLQREDWKTLTIDQKRIRIPCLV